MPLIDELEEMVKVAFDVESAVISSIDSRLPTELLSSRTEAPAFHARVPLIGEKERRIGELLLMDSAPRADLAAEGQAAIQRFGTLIAGVLTKAASFAGEAVEVAAAAERFEKDALTGLPNREALLRVLQRRIDAQDTCPRNYALLFVDIDFFKRINDSLGHLLADAVLVEVGRRMEETVLPGSGSTVARLAGDEFAVVLGDVSECEDAMTYAALLEYLLRTSIVIEDGHEEIFLSASVGIAFGRRGVYADAEQMLEDADVAMSRAKRQGRAQCVVFSEKMREKAKARIRLERDLREALRTSQFEVFYQPKVRLESGAVRGFEALIRWRHPERGNISPAEFIPVAEDTGLILEIGRWVTSRAIHQMSRWIRLGLVPADANMAVNLSACEFDEADLLSWLLLTLKAAHLPPHNLVLEVTESLLVEESTSKLELLQQIRAEGIGLDLDDFGTGYSSLSYLHRFPFRSIKIDRSFVSQMATEPKSKHLVSTIVGLAKSMQMGVIAEGVETAGQAEVLRKMGCLAAQGFLYSPAIGARELEETLVRSGGFFEPKPVVQVAKPFSGERMKVGSGVHYVKPLRFRSPPVSLV